MNEFYYTVVKNGDFFLKEWRQTDYYQNLVWTTEYPEALKYPNRDNALWDVRNRTGAGLPEGMLVIEQFGSDRERDYIMTKQGVLAEPSVCEFCNEVIRDLEAQVVTDMEQYFCSDGCYGSFNQNEAEAAYDRYLERYYGGEIATQTERLREAWKEKQRGR